MLLRLLYLLSVIKLLVEKQALHVLEQVKISGIVHVHLIKTIEGALNLVRLQQLVFQKRMIIMVVLILVHTYNMNLCKQLRKKRI